jgi:hypothetical protein
VAECLLLAERDHRAGTGIGTRRTPHLGLLKRRDSIDAQEFDLL